MSEKWEGTFPGPSLLPLPPDPPQDRDVWNQTAHCPQLFPVHLGGGRDRRSLSASFLHICKIRIMFYKILITISNTQSIRNKVFVYCYCQELQPRGSEHGL